jgi:hypothetical protein
MTVKRDNGGKEQAKSRWVGLAQLALVLVVVVVAVILARAPARVERVAPVADSGGSAQEAGAAPPVVEVFQPSATAESLVVELTGTVGSQRTVRLRSEVTGRLGWVSSKLTSGGAFAADEPIVMVDPTEFELRVDHAAAAVRGAEARVEVARESGEAARRVAEAELAEARVVLQLAELDLQRTVISLPFASSVIASGAEVGELVGGDAEGSGDGEGSDGNIALLYREGALEVRVPIDPPDLEKLEPVMGRSARVSARTGSWDAEVAGVSSVVAPSTHLAVLFLHFGEGVPSGSLPRPGTFVEVRLEGPVHENVLLLPDSVLRGGGSVWIVKSGRLVKFVPRSIGRAPGGELVEAFDTGEGVVIGALAGATEGLAVELTYGAP